MSFPVSRGSDDDPGRRSYSQHLAEASVDGEDDSLNDAIQASEVDEQDDGDAPIVDDREDELDDNEALRSIKSIMDNVVFLEAHVDKLEREIAAMELAALNAQFKPLQYNGGSHTTEAYNHGSTQTNVTKDLQHKREVLQKFKEKLYEERIVLRGLDITLPGSVTPINTSKGIYDSTYTLREALLRPSPMAEGQLPSTIGTLIRPRPVMHGTPIRIMSESDPEWDPEWLSLKGPHLDLALFVSQLQNAKNRLAMLGDDAPKATRDAAMEAVKRNRTAVTQIRVIRRYFEDGYTVHPNQIVSPKQLPKDGLCKRYVLYTMCLNLRQLLAIRDRNKEIGLCMSPLDFLRWRISVTCQKHHHGNNELNIRSCLKRLYQPNNKGVSGDEIFRQAVLRSAQIRDALWRFNKSRKTQEKKKDEPSSSTTHQHTAGTVAHARGEASAPVADRSQTSQENEDATMQDAADADSIADDDINHDTSIDAEGDHDMSQNGAPAMA